MRADRLLALMMILQTRGKQTAQALAEELEVSRRTILRDVDALSLAGVPIYTEGGHGGGIALDEQYRTRLTGLHTPEVQALFIANNQAVLRDVGLSDAADQLLRKLLAALPTPHHLTVDHIRQRLLIDSTWWWRDAAMPPFWDDLQQAVYADRLIDATYERNDGEVVARVLEPYSLVNKSSQWYLIARRDGALRTYRVARFHRVQLLDRHFVRAPDFDLPRYWEDHLQEFTDSFSEYACTLRIHPARVAFVKWLLPGRWQAMDDPDAGEEDVGKDTDGDPEDGRWITLRLMMDSPQLAKMLVFGLGTFVEILAPADLADAVVADAKAMVAHLTRSA